jgi:hypothetical protein
VRFSGSNTLSLSFRSGSSALTEALSRPAGAAAGPRAGRPLPRRPDPREHAGRFALQHLPLHGPAARPDRLAGPRLASMPRCTPRRPMPSTSSVATTGPTGSRGPPRSRAARGGVLGATVARGGTPNAACAAGVECPRPRNVGDERDDDLRHPLDEKQPEQWKNES